MGYAIKTHSREFLILTFSALPRLQICCSDDFDAPRIELVILIISSTSVHGLNFTSLGQVHTNTSRSLSMSFSQILIKSIAPYYLKNPPIFVLK